MTFYITDGIFHKSEVPPPSSMMSIPFEAADDAEEITIPDGVTSIWRAAFSNRCSMRKVNIPPSVTSIGRIAFAICTALEEITIPEGVIAIGNNAFDSCTSLRSVTLPSSITSIAEYTFLNCSALRTVSIPNGVKNIGTWAFCFCTALEEVTLPESLTTIGRNVFHGCNNLKCISLSKHHLSLSGLYDTLQRVQSIRCIAPIDEISDDLRLKACIGFAENEADYPAKLRGGYFEFLHSHSREHHQSILNFPVLLRLMCRERLLDASCFDKLFKKALSRENAELTAALLEYKHAHLASADDLSLD